MMVHQEEREYILSVLAQNHAGVLLRIAGLFSGGAITSKALLQRRRRMRKNLRF